MADKIALGRGIAIKIAELRDNLSVYKKVAVAFSGGVDSTVVLDNCCRIFPPENVVVLHAHSCLQAKRVSLGVKEVLAKHFLHRCTYLEIECDPLEWPDFILNCNKRCYYCKKRTYGLLLQEKIREECDVLLDGTNADDLHQYRPGLKAVQELGIVSPLLQAQITKAEIREYAMEQGLINHALPSNSCLATRVAIETPITSEMLSVIEDAEEFLHSLGFAGARVRPEKDRTCIEVQVNDMTMIVENKMRRMIVEYFQSKELGPVFLGISGR